VESPRKQIEIPIIHLPGKEVWFMDNGNLVRGYVVGHEVTLRTSIKHLHECLNDDIGIGDEGIQANFFKTRYLVATRDLEENDTVYNSRGMEGYCLYDSMEDLLTYLQQNVQGWK
jgi:hypothetical protein